MGMGKLGMKFLSILVLMFGSIMILSTELTAQVYPEGMVSYWKFEEGNGNTALDALGNNNGTINGATYDVGLVGGTLSFDGSNDYVEIPDDPSLRGMSQLTVEAWIYPKTVDPYYQGIVVKRNNTGWTEVTYQMYLDDDYEGCWNVSNGGSPGGDARCGGPSVLAINKWYHFVGLYTGQMAELYINGNACGQAPFEGGNVSNKLNHRFLIGTFAYGGSQAYSFYGLIDEVAVYNRALTQEEITQHYQNGLNGLGYEILSGSITGKVTENGTGLAGVTVKLLDNENPSIVIADPISTDQQGDYIFSDIFAGTYQVMVVEPLGYSSNHNFVETALVPGGTETVDFNLTAEVISNGARSKGYWKHQFDAYVRNIGTAQESEQDLITYIAEVDVRYNPHFDIFDGMTNGVDKFVEWQNVLSVKGNAGMEAKAKAQLAALVMNIMSLKVAQNEVVTADNWTAGDVLTFVSELMEDGDGSNDELAKDLAEQVNQQQTIAASLVSSSQSILYKGGKGLPHVERNAGIPKEFAVEQNYPNPLNPTTMIHFDVATPKLVRLTVFDVLGREVNTLVNESLELGKYSVEWDGTNEHNEVVAGGVYYYRMVAGDFVATRKMLLLK
jgi:hypothetical protein